MKPCCSPILFWGLGRPLRNYTRYVQLVSSIPRYPQQGFFSLAMMHGLCMIMHGCAMLCWYTSSVCLKVRYPKIHYIVYHCSHSLTAVFGHTPCLDSPSIAVTDTFREWHGRGVERHGPAGDSRLHARVGAQTDP